MNEALRLVRVFHNLKQKQLAETLDISPSYLNEIESGKKHVTMEILQKYSDYFRIPLSSLLYFAEQKDRQSGKRVANPIAAKAIKMLHWIETKTRNDEDEAKISA